ncbi:Arginine--tRNA ligase [Candidatus Kinetoplastibacterium sorsogonicusi]|uniref:Arginine--tRNA ligase n=1 Tax=Candidatus Kinetoplastidibacterium kentomonadis TaxID=1576550 RepID=A0A3S7J907_9PROT|nr:arginine--tRNA ligase [Candidatus Kinetoplastibacterium sorsogonicusi]AWD32155.1 Arginine--tRNA ligase [Candidatus Kinetoplastibacterium sorsogonicusi]
MLLKEQKIKLSLLLKNIIKDSINISIDNIVINQPKLLIHGDFSTNISLILSQKCQLSAMNIASILVDHLNNNIHLIEFIDKIEYVKPGFINFYRTHQSKVSIIKDIEQLSSNYGKKSKNNQKIIVEFVSANPTGPLHVGHARQAVIGDVLCNLYETIGYDVTREFYYNDSGNQIDNLVHSVIARAKNIDINSPLFPENGYKGEYIVDIVKQYLQRSSINNNGLLIESDGDIENLELLKKFAVAYLRKEQDIDLKAFNVKFDNYYLESSLYSSGLVEKTVNKIINNQFTYEKDGALWLKTTSLKTGDDKDRVMKKRDGSYTYFVPDIAYHKTKWDRGFKKAINIQGSDHHGTIARVRAGLQALKDSIPINYPTYILHKMVKIIKSGQEVKVSKRSGSYVTMSDLINWVGRDAARYFLIQRKADTEFTFDVDLAILKNEENPVFYIQYAHARMCSIIKKSTLSNEKIINANLELLRTTSEIELLKILSEFPEIVEQSVKELSPHNMAFWLRECASKYHQWYNSDKIITNNPDLTASRLRLMKATKQVLLNGLKIIGISAPESM